MAGAGHGDWPVKASRLCCRHPRIRSEKSWKIVVGPWPLVVGQAAMDSPTTKDQGRGSSAAARAAFPASRPDFRPWKIVVGPWPLVVGQAAMDSRTTNGQRRGSSAAARACISSFRPRLQTVENRRWSLAFGRWPRRNGFANDQRPRTKDQGRSPLSVIGRGREPM